MKKWNVPSIEELNISCTEQGKKIATNYDEIRVDQNGNYWVSFSSGAAPEVDPNGEVIVK